MVPQQRVPLGSRVHREALTKISAAKMADRESPKGRIKRRGTLTNEKGSTNPYQTIIIFLVGSEDCAGAWESINYLVPRRYPSSRDFDRLAPWFRHHGVTFPIGLCFSQAS